MKFFCSFPTWSIKIRKEKISKYTFKIILTQGLNRQIRRMCEYLGYRVVKLKRIRFMNIELGDLKVGEYKILDSKKVRQGLSS